MIIVTGATGKLGQLVIQELLKTEKPQTIIAAVRDVSKAQKLKGLGIVVREADYSRPETLKTAFQGGDKLLLISGNEVGKREPQHKAVIAAAKDAGVPFIAYTSILGADTTKLALAGEHLATEKAILASGLKYAFLRNGWYFENHTENLAPALEHGAIIGAAKEGRFASASRADFAAAAAKVLTTSGHENKIYELAGDTSFTIAELAAEVSKQSGKKVIYKDLPEADYAKALEGFGLPGPFAAVLADSDAGAAKGWLASSSKDLSKLIGRPTTSLATAVKLAVQK